MAYSNDGIQFTEAWTPVSERIVKIVQGGEMILAITQGGSIISSWGGVTWDRIPVKYHSLQDIIYADGQFVAVGNQNSYPPYVITSSKDGRIWTDASFTSEDHRTEALTGIAYGKGIYVAVGYSRPISSKGHRGTPPIYVSRDFGKTFSLVKINRSNVKIEGVVFFDGRFHAFGQGGLLLESSDGESWKTSNGEALSTQSFLYGVSGMNQRGLNGSVLLTDQGNLLHTRFERFNNDPIAQDDTVEIPFGESAQINVLLNDSDPDGSIAPASIEIISQPDGGTLRILENGIIEYIHNSIISGSDNFSYRVSDNEGDPSNIAYVTFKIGNSSPAIFNYPVDSMLIDGNIADWDSMLPVGVDARELRGLNKGLDWRDLYVAHNPMFLIIAYTSYMPAELNWAHNIFIDSDRDTGTGYKYQNMGVEYLIQQGEVYQYSGDGTSWSWAYLFDTNQSQNGLVVELAIARAIPGHPKSINMAFYAANGAYSPEGNIPDDFYPDGGGYIQYSLAKPGENQKPIAKAGIHSTFTNQEIEFSLRPTDPEGQPIKVSVVNAPAHGKIVQVNDSSNQAFTGMELAGRHGDIGLVYIPNDGFSGIDSFEWIISDGTLDSDVIVEEFLVYKRNDNGGIGFPVYNLTVDGSLDDWRGIPAIALDEIDHQSSPDWRSVWIANSPHYLHIAAKTQTPTNVDWSFNAFLDTDTSSSTGFRGAKEEYALGAEYLLQGTHLFKYTGSGVDWAWEWIKAIPQSSESYSHEWKVSLADLNNPSAVDIVLKSEDKEGENHDYIPDAAKSESVRYLISKSPFLNSAGNQRQPVDIRLVKNVVIDIIPMSPSAINSQNRDINSTPFAVQLELMTGPDQGWRILQSENLIEWRDSGSVFLNNRSHSFFMPSLEGIPAAFFKAIPAAVNSNNKF